METRIAILRNKAETEHLKVPDDTLSYIAGQIDSNIRELEGALMRVQAYAKLNGQPVSTSLAAEALQSLNGAPQAKELSIAMIQEKVAKFFHVTVAELKGKKRVKTIVIPRQIAMYLARELTEASLPKIGQEFGGKDHTTVIHAREALKSDEELKKEVAKLRAELHS